MTLSLDTAYRSFGGEVEASSTPTICRLPDSRRHQLSAIARQSLARAFDRAWDGYYRSTKRALNQDIARTELARRLVELSRGGVRDERVLAKAGFYHLRDLGSGEDRDN